MKKLLFFASALLLMAACGEKGKEYIFFAGVTGSSGPNCHTFDYNVNPDTLTLNGVADGDSTDVTLKLKFEHKTGAEAKPFNENWYVKVRGRDDAEGVELSLYSNDEGMAAVKNLPEGQTTEVVFSGKAATTDLEKLNSQKAWTTVIMN